MAQLRDTSIGSQKLLNIREGMSVYDVNGDRIGKVKQLYFGTASERANSWGEGSATAPALDIPGEDTLIGDVAETLIDENRFPEVVRGRLLHDGFLRINNLGILSSDRYVLPEQVSNVEDDRVNLNVAKNDLIKS